MRLCLCAATTSRPEEGPRTRRKGAECESVPSTWRRVKLDCCCVHPRFEVLCQYLHLLFLFCDPQSISVMYPILCTSLPNALCCTLLVVHAHAASFAVGTLPRMCYLNTAQVRGPSARQSMSWFARTSTRFLPSSTAVACHTHLLHRVRNNLTGCPRRRRLSLTVTVRWKSLSPRKRRPDPPHPRPRATKARPRTEMQIRETRTRGARPRTRKSTRLRQSWTPNTACLLMYVSCLSPTSAASPAKATRD